MSDLTLETTLVGNAGPLNDALRDAGQGMRTLTQQAEAANKGQASSSAQVTNALQAQAAATKGVNMAQAATTASAQAAGAAARKAAGDVDAIGVSARQTAAAMRMLPAQMTDVVTQLQGGASPFTVLLQQGGQVKDSFGGFGPMFRGITAAITPMAAAIGVGAVAAGVLYSAYSNGRAEGEAYAKAIILTGNAAGVTKGQLGDMAAQVSAVAGSQALAADVLAQLTGTGRVAVQNLRDAAVTAIAVQRSLGQSVATTVEQYAALGRDPLQASLRLNDQYRYLTKSVYDQIKALVERGKVEDAAEVAQKAYGQAMSKRAAQMEGELGTLEKLWRGIGDAAKGAWDKMLNVGRQQSLSDQLKSVNIAIEQFQKEGRKSQDPVRDAQRLQALLDQRETLTKRMLREDSNASAEAAAVKGNDQAIRDAEELARQEGAIRSAQRAKQLAEIKAYWTGVIGAYDDGEKILEARRQGGLIDEATYWEAKRAFARLASESQISQLQAENAALAAQTFKRDEVAARIQRDTKVAENLAAVNRARAEGQARIVVLNAQEAASVDALARSTKTYVEQLQLAAQTRATQQQRELAGLGRGDNARAIAAATAAEEDRFLEQRRQLEADLTGRKLTQAEYDKRLAALTQYHNDALARESDFQQQKQRLQGNGELGTQRAIENYMDQAGNVAAQTEKAWTSAFQGMEDAAVRFFTWQKVGFKDMAMSIIADLVRIEVKQSMVTAMKGAQSFGGGLSGLVGWVGSLFGGSYDIQPGYGDFAGPRAGGGDVQPGKTYLVGEKGPELLRMGANSGMVVPNDALGGGTNVTQHITYNVPPGMTPAAFASALEQNNQRLKGSIANDMLRPGRTMNRAAALSRL